MYIDSENIAEALDSLQRKGSRANNACNSEGEQPLIQTTPSAKTPLSVNPKQIFVPDSVNNGDSEEDCPETTDEYKRAREKILKLLSVRDRSSEELRTRLVKDGFDPSAVEAVIKRFRECLIIDDMRFADSLIRTRLNALMGTEGVARELTRYGIAPEDIPGFPDDYLADLPSPHESALRLLETKPPRGKDQFKSAYGKLLRKGYSSSIAYEVAREWARSN